jgi:membrane protein implicated in regulation of membrane protease activity
MGIVYLAALILGFGILAVQMAFAGHGDAAEHGDGGHGAEHHGDKDAGSAAGAVAIFLSLRFWTFAALAFGLSGSLLHHFGLASFGLTLALASVAGLSSGLFAALAFRAAVRLGTSTRADASSAVGTVGRVLVGCSKGQVGQVRIELGGSSVDFMATTDEDELRKGELVLVEEMRGAVAHVGKRPPELV